MTPTDKLTEMTFHDYKDRFAAALERLCEQFPERDLDDLKREAEKQVNQQHEDKPNTIR